MPGNKRGRPPSRPQPNIIAGPQTICKKCFSIIGRGLTHDCKLKHRTENLIKSLNIPPIVQEKIASSIIKEKMKSVSETTVSLKTGGKPLRISPNIPTPNQLPTFKFQGMSNLMTKRNMSAAAAEDMCSAIRTIFRRKSVEPGIREKIQEHGHLLDEHFKLTNLRFIIKNPNGQQEENDRTTILVQDADNFIQGMIKARGYNPSTSLVKLGLDGGGGFFKITINIIDKEREVKSPTQKSSRRLFSQGVAPETQKDSSVKKLFIIALVPDIPESYENMKVLFNELKLDRVKCVVATDLKLANIVLGLSAHGAIHSCCWCEANSRDWSRGGSIRTLGKIRQNYQNFCQAGGHPKNAQYFYNCIHLPLFSKTDNTSILELIPPPELHLLLGSFNHLYDGLENEWKGATEWAKKTNVQRVAWRGRDGRGHFQGNECRKLLKNLDLLDTMVPLPPKKIC